jgi:hypothetical protein
MKYYHKVNSWHTTFILLFSYSIHIILKDHSVYQKLISMEKKYSEKLEREVKNKTLELQKTK